MAEAHADLAGKLDALPRRLAARYFAKRLTAVSTTAAT
jgi:hypothetical protein